MNRVCDAEGHVMDSVCSNGRASGAEHGQIQNRVCDAEGTILDSICQSGRTSGSEHAKISTDVCNAQGMILTSLCENTNHVTSAVRDAAYANLKNTCDSTSEIVDQVVSTSNVLRGAVERIGDNLHNNIVNTTTDVKNAVERNGSANLAATERVGTATLLSVERNSGEGRAQAERIAAEVRSLLGRNDSNILLTAKDNLLELCKAAGVLERQAADNTASIKLEALKNKEALARQLAECCCEIKEQSARESCEIKELTRQESCDIKEKIDFRANETNLLVRELDTSRVRDDLTAANTENLILRLKKQCCTLPLPGPLVAGN
jgi:hypothetical protein